MTNYQTVNNPYEPNVGTYPNGGYPNPNPAPAPVASTAPPGWAQAPDGSWVQVPVTPTPTPAPAPVAPAPVAPTPAAAPPVPAAPPAPQNTNQTERRQVIKYRTQSGEPLEALNLVMMTGYFHHIKDQNGNPKWTQSGNSVRLGFLLAEEQVWTDNEGKTQTRVTWHRCQAWNDFAKTLVQVHDGTPIKIWGNLVHYYPRDDQGNITATIVDIKVNKFEFP